MALQNIGEGEQSLNLNCWLDSQYLKILPQKSTIKKEMYDLCLTVFAIYTE